MSETIFGEAQPYDDPVRISGRVKWFDAGKGYGFVVPDDPSQTGSRDVLLHVTSLRNMGRENALEGSIIVCDVVKRPKGWQVSDIVDLDETSASPAMERPRRTSDGDSHGGGGFRRDRGGDDRPRGGFGGPGAAPGGGAAPPGKISGSASSSSQIRAADERASANTCITRPIPSIRSTSVFAISRDATSSPILRRPTATSCAP